MLVQCELGNGSLFLCENELRGECPSREFAWEMKLSSLSESSESCLAVAFELANDGCLA